MSVVALKGSPSRVTVPVTGSMAVIVRSSAAMSALPTPFQVFLPTNAAWPTR